MLCTRFLRRGYQQKLLMDAAILARQKVRAVLLRPEETEEEIEEEERVFLITTFPTTTNLYKSDL